MSKLEIVEDIFIVLDLVVSFAAAILKGKGFITLFLDVLQYFSY